MIMKAQSCRNTDLKLQYMSTRPPTTDDLG